MSPSSISPRAPSSNDQRAHSGRQVRILSSLAWRSERVVPYHILGVKTSRRFIQLFKLAFKISRTKLIISPYSSKFDNISCSDSDHQLVYDIGLVNTVHDSISDLLNRKFFTIMFQLRLKNIILLCTPKYKSENTLQT